MKPVDMHFLKAVFPVTMQGYIRFATGVPGDFPQKVHWFSVEEFHTFSELPFEYESKEVYFTPHTFTEPKNVTKADTLDCKVLWIECDDEDFNPLSIVPYSPSVVIETSPGRTHVYWFIEGTPEPQVVERYNRALAYKFLRKDRSGWCLTKLLRVPGTKNRKRKIPHTVKLLSFETNRIYSFDDFGDLKHNLSDDFSRDPDESIPTELPPYDKVKSDWQSHLPKIVQDLLTTQQKDRSKALWRLANECQRIGMSPAETYVLLKESPNNKFSESRFNGEQELWKDIKNAFRLATRLDRQQAVNKITQLRQDRALPPDIRREEISKLVYKTMALDGRFYHAPRTVESIYYQREPSEKAVSISPNSQECQTYLNTKYALNGTTAEFRYVAEHIRSWTEYEAQHVSIHDLSYYDRKNNILYVGNNAGGIYRLDGKTIELVENGVDGGVFFRPSDDAQTYKPNFTARHDLIDKILFDRINLTPHQYPEKDARFLIKSWFYSLFFNEMFETRPLLIFEGPHGSGKTTSFKCMEWVLRGAEATVSALPLTADGYKEIVREQNHVFFDGVDQPFKGLAELLSITATGTKDRRRILYTDNRFAEYKLRAFVGITTMDAAFLRNDVADRAVVLRTDRREEFVPESEIKKDIFEQRDLLWGNILSDLNHILKTIPETKVRGTKLRMADFAHMITILATVCDHDPDKIIDFLKSEQTHQVLKRNVVWSPLEIWLQKSENRNRPVSASELHTELIHISHRKNFHYAKGVRSSSSLAHRLKKLRANVNFEKRPAGRQWVYVFK